MRIHKILTAVVLAAGLAASMPLAAQESGRQKRYAKDRSRSGPPGRAVGRRGPVGQDLMDYLYPVELIRHYSTDINLTEQQIKKIHKIMSDTGDEVEKLKWDLEKEAQKLVDLVKAGADKGKIYSQMDKIFAIENKIKKKHLGLMIEVRDVLTKKQRKILDKVKSEAPEGAAPLGGPLPGPPAGAPMPHSLPTPPPPPPTH